MTFLLTALLMAAPVAVDAARNDYSKCLRTFTRDSLKAEKTEMEFNASLRDACLEKETVYRDAIIRVDKTDGFTQKEAEEDAELQISDYVENFKEKFIDFKESNTMPGDE